MRTLIDGADLLITNAYEAAMVEHKTGWSADDVLKRVSVRITTHAADGAVIAQPGSADVRVPVVQAKSVADPTGVGDAFRAGLLSARSWGLSWERSAQVGSLLATLCLESTGPQDYSLDRDDALSRVGTAYGDDVAQEIAPHLPA